MEVKTLLQIVLEAEPAKEPDPEDYTEVEAPEEPAEDPPEEETPEEDKTEEPEEETDTEDEPTDYTDEPSTDEPADAETDTTTTSEEPAEGEPDDGDEANNQYKKSKLLEDFISLYYLIKNTHERVVTINFESVETNQIVIQVSNFLLKLKEEVYTYITGQYKTDKYVMNLYKYNQSIQSLNILVEMIRKSKEIQIDGATTKKKA